MIVGIIFALFFMGLLAVVVIRSRPYRCHCDYCGRDFVVQPHGRINQFLVERDGKLVEDASCRQCFYNHASLLLTQKMLKRKEGKPCG